MAEAEAGGDKTVQEQCVELLNQSALLSDPAEKLINLKKVQELIIHQDPALLDNFLDEVVAFQTDVSPDVRRSVICFIEEACKKDNEMVPKVVANLCILLQDSFSVAVVKRTIQAISCIYKIALQWLSSSRSVSEVMDSAWTMLCRMKQQIQTYFDHDNDGVRTMAVKFMETLVLLQTYSESDGMKRNDFCLDGVPITLKIARPRKLEEEARNVFNQMLKFHGSPHISSVNLMACMSAITLIARFRPSFLNQVISAMESLHANLPPTLSKSQVNSVRKHMKMQLLNLLKQPASYDSHQNICTLLTDLGASQSEVMRAMPPPDEVKKRQRRAAADSSADKDGDRSSSKRPKISTAADDEDEDEYEDQIAAVKRPAHDVDKRKHKTNAIDITESWVVDRLTASVAANLVLVSMHLLPETVPPQFSNTFTPIAAAGTPSQIRHVSRLLSAQLTHVGIGPGVEATRNRGVNMTEMDWEMEEEEEDNDSSRHTISTVLGGSVVDNKQPPAKKEKIALLPSGQIKRHMVRALKLQDITHALPRETTDRLMNDALDRFMRSEKVAQGGGLASTHVKLLTTMSAHFSDHLIEKLLAHVLEDIRGRSDLCIAWLFEEYSSMLGFSNFGLLVKSESKYEQIICMLVSALMCRPDLSDGEALLSRLYLEAPVIPDSAIDILKGFTADADHHVRGIALLHALAVRRPPKQLAFIAALLELSNHQHEGVQMRAMQAVLELHGVSASQAAAVEEHAVDQLKYLTLPEPPSLLLMNLQQSGGPPPAQNKQWTDDLVKMCLRMYLALLPKNESLIHELARVYVQTAADVKRTILRVVEMPVRGMGMQSPELLSLVEQCPKGAETLVTRVIHILTDKTPPSADLVDRVRDLYQKRVSDVRFLIPVLNGLTKREVIAALPKLIKLNPVVVKEVFNRLLGIHADTANFSSPITPEELLVALHNIDPAKCDMKTIIKATSLCFTEKHVYTQEVLAVVLQQLMDQDPLPTLLMRTVIQSLALYNRLIGFVMNILQRLITREVWNQKRVWEGFIKCCQRTRPSSYQVLLQLPAEPLGQVFEAAPEMRQQMLDFVNNFNEAQRAHVPDEIMSLITSGTLVKSELNAEPMSPPEIDSIDPLQVIQRRHIKEEPTEELSIAAEDY